MLRRAAAFIVTLTACGSFSEANAPPPASGAVDAGPVDAGAIDASTPGCGWAPFGDDYERSDVRGAWGAGAQSPADGITVSLGPAPMPRGESLHVAIAASTAANTGRFFEFKHVLVAGGGPTPSCVDVAFAAFPVSHGDDPSGIATIEMNNETALSVWLAPTGFEFFKQTANGDTFERLVHADVAFGQWHAIVVHVADGQVSIVVDGLTQKNEPTQIKLGDAQEVHVGAGFTRGIATGEFFIDDVSIR